MRRQILLCAFLAIVIICGKALASENPVTVFAPSVTGIEALPDPEALKKQKIRNPAWRNEQIPEVDILMALLRPNENMAEDMDMPQMFAMYFTPAEGGEASRRDLLGDVEEIRYEGKKAWGANVALSAPGLYQFIFEGRPFWNQEDEKFIQYQAKLYLPVLANGDGWEKALGQQLELVPLTRPFGLTAPALFSGLVLADGKAAAYVPVKAARLNTAGRENGNRWSRSLESRTDEAGRFSLLFNQPGWWYCEARTGGQPLKGPDGQLKEVEKYAIIWIYVEAPAEERKKK